MALQVPWNDVPEWLESLGLGQYGENFSEHAVTGEDMPFLQDYQLLEMGVISVGDRIRILAATERFMRSLKNEQRNKVIMKFKDWYPISLCSVYERAYEVSESAIEVKDPQPCRCRKVLDHVDITSITDIRLEVGCFFTFVIVKTSDASYKEKGGFIKMRLRHNRARRVHGTLKNLWEEDQQRLGLRGEDAKNTY